MSKSLFTNTAIGYAAQALYNQFTTGSRAARLISEDPPFSNSMAVTRRPFVRRSTKRSYRRRPMRMLRNVRSDVVSFVRNTAQSNFTTLAGSVSNFTDTTLGGVFTSDLIGSWDVYRIKKVTAVIQPIFDAANGQTVNNTVLYVGAFCDTQGTVLGVPNMTNIGAYSKHRVAYVPAGKNFVYSYYPKVINSVDNNGTSAPLGSYGANPWLLLTSAGIGIPHHRLVFRVESSLLGTPNTQTFSIMFQIHFDCKRTR